MSTDSQQAIDQLRQFVNQHIVGQESLVRRLLIALLADGHLLVEGVPGLAKTKAVKTLAMGLEAYFQRIQFTPDLLPSDIIGTEIYQYREGFFKPHFGPIFHNLVLADEINRAPAKAQSALLEAMGERQVTIGHKTYPLPDLFLVMATQNPIEQEGTYPLSEAQLDRFLLHVRMDYPDVTAEHEILRLVREEAQSIAHKSIHLTQQELFAARKEVLKVHLSSSLEKYLVQLVVATRNPKPYSQQLSNWLEFGASPRATIALDRCARAHAWLEGRDYVSPEDIHAMVYDVLRHRLILSIEAEAKKINTDQCIKELLENIPVP
jgi:MoxR-like ATPase